MLRETKCRACGVGMLVALVVISTAPAELCEKCRHEHAAHAQEESTRTTWNSNPVMLTMSGSIPSTITTMPPWV